MQGLCLHSGARHVSLKEVAEVPIPEHTETWFPVPYMDAINHVKSEAKRVLGRKIVREGYGLSAKDNQLFGVLGLESELKDRGLSIGLRQSYDQSLALGVAVGAVVFVCDNLAFSGAAVKVIRRNTRNVWRDFCDMFAESLDSAGANFKQLNEDIDKMKKVDVPQRQGYEIIGYAQGCEILKPTQATVALGEWTKPSHEEFAERTLWSLYNSFTEAMKRGSQGLRIDRQVGVHSFFLDRLTELN